MTVEQIEDGRAFRVSLGPYGHIDYRLVYKTQCGAYVENMRKTKKTIKHADPLADLTGESTTTTEIESASGKTTISLGTECEPLLDGDLPGNIVDNGANGPAPVGKKPRQPRGDRHFDPKAQERPVRDGTKRAEMIALTVGKKMDIKKVMAKFSMERNLVIAHVHEFWNCHGYGYHLVGDTLEVLPPLPAGEGTDDLL